MSGGHMTGGHKGQGAGSHRAVAARDRTGLLAAVRRSALRRHGVALALLLPAAALALGTAAMQYQTVYLPTTMSRAHGPQGSGGWSHLDATTTEDSVAFHREVSARIVARPETSAAATGAAAGGGSDRSVVLRVQFGAPPSAPLRRCRTVVVGSDGAQYSAIGYTDPQNAGSAATERDVSAGCVPERRPGPDLALGAKALSESPDAEGPRPQRWERTLTVQLPAGVTPAEVRIGWQEPDYLELAVPAS